MIEVERGLFDLSLCKGDHLTITPLHGVPENIAYSLLSEDYFALTSVMLYSQGYWDKILPNPYFLIDTNVNSYFAFKNENDSSWL